MDEKTPEEISQQGIFLPGNGFLQIGKVVEG